MKLKLPIILIINYFSIFIYSQELQNIETQEITVKKSFTPKVSNTKKIKSKMFNILIFYNFEGTILSKFPGFPGTAPFTTKIFSSLFT